MKSILYVGATLMIGASIYGFVDYQKTSRNKEFKNMYKENQSTDPAIVTNSKTTDPAVIEKTMKVKKQVINNNKNNAVVKSIAEDQKMRVTENKEPGKTEVTVTSSKEDVAEKIVKHKKRIFSPRLFSRAPLDERYIDKQIKTEELKTKKESGKIENKEQ